MPFEAIIQLCLCPWDGSAQLNGFEFVARAVADVEDFDLLLSLVGPVDDPIDVRLVTIEQIPEIFVFGSCRTAVRLSTQGANRIS